MARTSLMKVFLTTLAASSDHDTVVPVQNDLLKAVDFASDRFHWPQVHPTLVTNSKVTIVTFLSSPNTTNTYRLLDFMKFLTLAAALLAQATSTFVQAATCDQQSVFICVENGGSLAGTSDVYAARADYCGNDRWKTQQCYKYKGSGINQTPIYITLDKPGANDRQTCWDATENMIQRESLRQSLVWNEF
ncbi:hypothetical protein VNI00_010096 [Paramarasmius palmivorus]|uniref:Uncharacterized protein n=1 Tax=Paramarasmius palmivorus TaxID=297713 RepID=A0AAW0CIW9_9AGAR